MSDDIVTRLRQRAIYRRDKHKFDADIEMIENEAADEIERLREERLQWFVVARQLRDALLGTEEKDAAVDEYLRTRGRLEDPREQAEG